MHRGDDSPEDPLAAWLREVAGTEASASATSPAASTAEESVPPAPAGMGPPWPHEEDQGRPRRRRLWALAALPWLLGAALAAAQLLGRDGSASSPPAVTDESAAAALDDPAPSPASPPGELVDQEADVGRRAAAVAELAVRMRVTSAEGATEPAVYVDHVRAEAMERDGQRVIVTVAAVVWRGHGDAWHEASPARFAVPLTADGDRVLADPWPLPAPQVTIDALDGEPVDDPELIDRAAAALATAGYTDVDVSGLQRLPDTGDLRVAATAVPPGWDVVQEVVVWLDAGAATVRGAWTPADDADGSTAAPASESDDPPASPADPVPAAPPEPDPPEQGDEP